MDNPLSNRTTKMPKSGSIYKDQSRVQPTRWPFAMKDMPALKKVIMNKAQFSTQLVPATTAISTLVSDEEKVVGEVVGEEVMEVSSQGVQEDLAEVPERALPGYFGTMSKIGLESTEVSEENERMRPTTSSSEIDSDDYNVDDEVVSADVPKANPSQMSTETTTVSSEIYYDEVFWEDVTKESPLELSTKTTGVSSEIYSEKVVSEDVSKEAYDEYAMEEDFGEDYVIQDNVTEDQQVASKTDVPDDLTNKENIPVVTSNSTFTESVNEAKLGDRTELDISSFTMSSTEHIDNSTFSKHYPEPTATITHNTELELHEIPITQTENPDVTEPTSNIDVRLGDDDQ